jgi:exosortase/archaeosortase family protein
VPTDTASSRPRVADFLLRAVAWGLGIFGLLRLEWIGRHALLPLTQFQGRLAAGIFGAPARPIVATLDCSGADLVAICLGAILAYPARWTTRLAGAGAGLALILALNTLRIGTLGRLAAAPSLFPAFHVYVWPAALALAVAGYVFAWMQRANRRGATIAPQPQPAAADPGATAGRRGALPARRFAILAAVLLVIFTAAAPIYLESAGVLSVAAFIARASAAVLRLLGIEAQASANQLWTSRGSFLVTQECISTPLIPVYLAAVFAFGGSGRSRLLALLAAAPLFVALGVARLLVVALPAFAAASPVALIHAFFQVVLAAVVVVAAALWRDPDRWRASRRAALGAAAGVLFVLLLAGPYTRLLLSVLQAVGPGAAPPAADPQGAIALLPAFQAGLFLALWVAARPAAGWMPFFGGVALLVAVQLATLAALPLLAARVGGALLVQGVRGWAVVAPVVVAALLHRFRPAGAPSPPQALREADDRG